MIKVYSFYHRATGILAPGNFSSTSADDVALNAPPDHLPIEGQYDHLSQRVDVSVEPEIVPVLSPRYDQPQTRAVHKILDYQPPKPSENHEWDAATKRWALNAATVARATARAAALTRIATLEASQHIWVRRHSLGDPSARAHLQEIDEEVAVLTGQL